MRTLKNKQIFSAQRNLANYSHRAALVERLAVMLLISENRVHIWASGGTCWLACSFSVTTENTEEGLRILKLPSPSMSFQIYRVMTLLVAV